MSRAGSIVELHSIYKNTRKAPKMPTNAFIVMPETGRSLFLGLT